MATVKKAMKKPMMKMGGSMKAKDGKSFPDLNKDGKITKADILVGKGVIKAKKGKMMKKSAPKKMAKPMPQAPMQAPPMGGGAPMMKKGGKMKKCAYGCK